MMSMRKKINISIAVFLGLDALIAAFLIYPAFSEIQNNSSKLIAQQKALSALDAKTANLEKFSSLYKNLEDVLAKINNLLVSGDVPVEFISFLEKTSLESGMKIDISPAPANPGKSDLWPSLGFEVRAVGSFPNFLKFLEKLEASPYLVEIQQLNVVSSDPSGESVDAEFLVKVFTK